MTLKYAPPVIEHSLEPSMDPLCPEDGWDDTHAGKFLLTYLDDTIRLWATVGAWTHNEVCDIIDKYEKEKGIRAYHFILGGGSISLNDKDNPTSVEGYSGDYGGLPNRVLKEYFAHFGYKDIIIRMDQKVKEEAVHWFREHGIEI